MIDNFWTENLFKGVGGQVKELVEVTRVGTELFLTTCALFKGVLRGGVPAVKAVDVGDILPAALPEILDILDILDILLQVPCLSAAIGSPLEMFLKLYSISVLVISSPSLKGKIKRGKKRKMKNRKMKEEEIKKWENVSQSLKDFQWLIPSMSTGASSPTASRSVGNQ